jgi:hypothetical protein
MGILLNALTLQGRVQKKQPLRVSAEQHAAVDMSEEPEDVAEENARVMNVDDYVSNPIVIRDLKKVYPGLDGQPPKVRGCG